MRYGTGWRIGLRLAFAVLVGGGIGAIVLLVGTAGLDAAARAIPLFLALFGAALAVWRWFQRRSVPEVSTPQQLDEALEALAEALGGQWRAEAARRGLANPAPVQVAWEVTRRPVADRPWVIYGAGVPAGGAGDPGGPGEPGGRPEALAPPGTGATKTALLTAGAIGHIHQLFEALPNRRLAIIGGAGTGKTTAAVVFVLDVLAHRSPGDHVPALISLSGWDADTENLVDFIARQLIRDHPYLRNPRYGKSAPDQLVVSGRVMPICDGLDEIPEAKRGAALTALNESGLPRLIVTSRIDEYQQATAGQVFAGAAVIELMPVDLDAAVAFLSEGRSPLCLAAWESVFATMREAARIPARAALTTPLMLSLARRVYADRSPEELLDATRFVTPADVEDHLLDAFVPASYSDPPQKRDRHTSVRRYRRAKAVRWLGYTASQARARESHDLAWWRAPRLVSWPLRASASMMLYALVDGLLASVLARTLPEPDEVASPFGLSLAGVPIIAYVIGRRRDRESLPALFTRNPGTAHILSSLAHGARVWIITAIPVAVALQIVVVALDDSVQDEPLPLMLAGLVVGAAIGLAAAIGAVAGREAPTVAPSPVQSFRAHLAYLVLVRLITGLVVVALLFLVMNISEDYEIKDAGLVAYYGLLIGLAFAITDAGGQYLVTVGLLAVTRKVPWRLLAFLGDAHRRGVLRQQGATYQFRHARLQERLAATYRMVSAK